jgi:hypothetical protein
MKDNIQQKWEKIEEASAMDDPVLNELGEAGSHLRVATGDLKGAQARIKRVGLDAPTMGDVYKLIQRSIESAAKAQSLIDDAVDTLK